MNESGIIFLAPKTPVFTTGQLERLSNIADNAGNVFLAVLVLSPFMSGIDNMNWFVVVLGLIITLSLWFLSFVFAKKGEIV